MSSATLTQHHPASNPAGVRLYWRASGLALAAVALLGIALNATANAALLGSGFLAFDWTHNVVHVLLAAVALVLGFAAVDVAVSKGVAKVVGLVYLGLAVVGFLSATVFGIGTLLGLHLELGENLVHLLIGGWGAYVGFSE